MDIYPPASPHRWESLLHTDCLGLKAIISQEEHTSLTFFFSCLYKIHPTCLSEILIKPPSLGFQKCVYISYRWSVVYPCPYLVFICNVTTTCVAAELPFSCLSELLLLVDSSKRTLLGRSCSRLPPARHTHC